MVTSNNSNEVNNINSNITGGTNSLAPGLKVNDDGGLNTAAVAFNDLFVACAVDCCSLIIFEVQIQLSLSRLCGVCDIM